MSLFDQSRNGDLDKCGIYRIINKGNGKFYLGSAKNIRERLVRHLYDLKRQAHHSVPLQRAWNKYGFESFFMEIVEQCGEDLLKIREQHFLDTMKPYLPSNGYNIGRQASGGDNLTSNPKKDEIIRKISVGIKTRIFQMSEEERHKKWSRPGNRNPNYGKKWTSEQKQHASKMHMGKKLSEETKKKLSEVHKNSWTPELREQKSILNSGDKNPFAGKHHSENSKKKIAAKFRERFEALSEEGKRKIGQVSRKEVIADGKQFESLTDAANYFGVTPTAIYNKIKAKKPNYYYVDDSLGTVFSRQVLVENQKFESLNAAVQTLKISRKTIIARIKANKVGYKFLESDDKI
jgi:group I intron endonuclease